MSNYQNHLIDPSYFYDAIEEFAFDYDMYSKSGQTIDEYGKVINTYTKYTIRGSLQSRGSNVSQSKSGNEWSRNYNFYCKSLYRININDIIEYKENYYMVNSVRDYDEFGVRSCELSMITLTEVRDFAEYIKYIDGDIIV